MLEGLRASLLGTPMPPTDTILWAGAVAIASFALGAFVFRRLERRFADVI